MFWSNLSKTVYSSKPKVVLDKSGERGRLFHEHVFLMTISLSSIKNEDGEETEDTE